MRTPNNGRVDWIDHLKAFGILLVVFGHSKGAMPEVEKWIYSFHMPLFFLVSGYLFREVALQHSFFAYAKKTVSSLIPPYIAFAIIGYLFWLTAVRHLSDGQSGDTPAYYPILATLYGTGTPETFQVSPTVLWFLPCLCSSLILFFVQAKLCGRLAGLSSLALLAIGFLIDKNIVLPFELETAFVGQFFVFLGFSANRAALFDKIRPSIKIPLALVFLAIGTMVQTLNPIVDTRTSEYGNVLYFLVAAILLSSAFALAFQLIGRVRLTQFISKNTITIFPLHLIGFSILSGVYVFALGLDLETRSNPIVAIAASLLMVFVFAVMGDFMSKTFPFIYGIKKSPRTPSISKSTIENPSGPEAGRQ